ncbi:MAG: Lrp/AsnC family transcriptional regulator [Candidatus Freyarchaeota archaeon]|nr:Lrp/AsnC family transcriptional regulator [Candidatus Jordarchaeia archaeon]MBS7268388.1 Lrp/AsnC family transcriptional regulator [Candidatus Jordarchaeia archaeon]MBS7278582.1 Lrp/AsnC family transcriptional regulator [Candidatus Jordarchaeia archaeon]
MKTVDNLDRKILEALEKDSRTSLKEIAMKTGVSVGTVNNRLKKLIDLKVIKQFMISIDWRKLDFDILAILLIETKYQKTAEVAKKIAKYPEVIKLYTCTGGVFDIIALVKSKNMESYSLFKQKKVDQLPEIEKVRDLMVTDEYV